MKRRRRSRKGIPLRRFTPQEDAMLRADFLAYVPMEDIAAKLNRTWGTTRQRVMHLGLHRSHITSKYLKHAPSSLKQQFLSGKIDGETLRQRCIAERVADEQQAREVKQQAWLNRRNERQVMIATILKRDDLSRNDMIRSMRNGGARLEEIAVQFGITRERVRQLCEPDFYHRVIVPRQIKRLDKDEQQHLMRRLLRYWKALSPELRQEFMREAGIG
jgi:hypothetical protein